MIEEVFHKAKLRLTRPRLLVFQVLEKNHRPQSAQNIHKQLDRRVDLVSVYRALAALERLDLIQRERTPEEDFFYLADKPHHHIVCTSCGRSECVPCTHNFSIKHFKNIQHELTLTGVCAQCS
jgi:Fe2+ or Zn2+ uptake regulation protein